MDSNSNRGKLMMKCHFKEIEEAKGVIERIYNLSQDSQSGNALQMINIYAKNYLERKKNETIR